MADSDNEGAGGGGGSGNPSGNEMSLREQDRLLPIANVSRIMKKALPANAKISKEAKETVQECVSEFISFVTGEASDKCQKEKRKTINGDDLLWAMTTLGFEDYMDPLKVYLQRFRESEGEKSMSLHDKDGPGGASSSSTTGLRNGDGFEGSGSSGVYGNSMVPPGPHVYGSSGFHHMAAGGSTGTGFGGLGKTGPGNPGPGSNFSRPK